MCARLMLAFGVPLATLGAFLFVDSIQRKAWPA